MAHTDVTRCGETAQKKTRSLMAVKVNNDLLTDNGLAIGTQNLLVANLPDHAVMVDAYVTVAKVSDAATTATVALGTAEGGAQIMAAADIKTTGVKGTLVGKLDTGTGQAIYLRIATAGATTTVGEMDVVIAYDEYEKNNGEYTRFS